VLNITNPVTPHDVIHQGQMYVCRSGTDELCCIFAWQAHQFHSVGGSTTLCCVNERHGRHFEIMMSNIKSDRQSMHIYLNNILPNFIPMRFETTKH